MELIRNKEIKLSELKAGSLFEDNGIICIKTNIASKNPMEFICIRVGMGVTYSFTGGLVIELLIKK